MKTKKLMLIMFGILFLGLVAATPAFFIKQGEAFQVKVSCENAGNFCSAGATCNLTISYPNSTILVNNAPMTNLFNGYFGYDLNPNQNQVGGEYIARAGCSDGGLSAATTFTYQVTATGNKAGYGMFLILILAAIVLFIGGYVIDQDWLVFLSGILWLITGVYTMIYGVGDLTNLYTKSIAGVTLAIGFVLILAAIFNISKSEGSTEYSDEE
jgi:hypothetical protein